MINLGKIVKRKKVPPTHLWPLPDQEIQKGSMPNCRTIGQLFDDARTQQR